MGIWSEMLRLCWPHNTCPLCGEKIPPIALAAGAAACPACQRRLGTYDNALPDRDCAPLLGFYAAAPYAGELRRELLRLKYNGGRALAGPLGSLLAECWRRNGPDWQAEVVAAVPLHAGRLRRRGFNQSELLAKAIGRSLGLPVAAGALLRVRETRPQSSVAAAEREGNVAGAFACETAWTEGLAGRRVLLVDDIITTGATMRSCAAALLAAGCAEVYGAAVAGA